MVSSLSNPVNNLSEGIHRIKRKSGQDDKKCETCGIKYKHCHCFLEYKNLKRFNRIQIFKLQQKLSKIR